MDLDFYSDVVEREGNRLLEAAAGDLAAPVAACPGWDVARLVGHVGQVHGWIAATVRSASTEPPRHGSPDLPEPADTLGWGRDQLVGLVDALRNAQTGTPTWTWAEPRVVDFFHRRMAHETLVHRYDVEHAVGELTPIDPDLAADGVDELIFVGLQSSANPDKQFSYPSGSLHLHRTDGDGEWLLRVDDGSLVATREHAKGDVAVRGAAADLLLYLWGRGGQNLEVFGDPLLAEAWSNAAP